MKKQPKWKLEIPHEVTLRLEEGSEPTLAEVIQEAEEIRSLIRGGESFYNDETEDEVYLELGSYIRKYKRYL